MLRSPETQLRERKKPGLNDVVVVPLTFLSEAFLPRHQSEAHHLGPGAVDLQLLQLWVLLDVLLCGFRLWVEGHFHHKRRISIDGQQLYSPQHTEPSEGLGMRAERWHHEKGSHSREVSSDHCERFNVKTHNQNKTHI